MVDYESDWDAATENRYAEHRERYSSGLCVLCRADEVLPDDELCASCLEEIEGGEDEEA